MKQLHLGSSHSRQPNDSRNFRLTVTAALFAGAFCHISAVKADIFGSGANQFNIEFVPIGNPNNPADTTGDPNPAGMVAYAYRMGTYEISRDMITKADSEGNLGITIGPWLGVAGGPRSDMPAGGVNWFEAARFVNWLNTSSGSPPAYKFASQPDEPEYDPSQPNVLWSPGELGYDSNNLFRNSRARYFLPSADEWYKAAYYDASLGEFHEYPTGSDTAPVSVTSGTDANTAVYGLGSGQGQGPADITLAGGLSPYGTMAQGGNVWEWEETEFDLLNDSVSSARGLRGADYVNAAFNLQSTIRISKSPGANLKVGFRVASIPEPSAALLAALVITGVLGGRLPS